MSARDFMKTGWTEWDVRRDEYARTCKLRATHNKLRGDGVTTGISGRKKKKKKQRNKKW